LERTPKGRCHLSLILIPETGGEVRLSAPGGYTFSPMAREKILNLKGVKVRAA
jgi:hypothetical protein